MFEISGYKEGKTTHFSPPPLLLLLLDPGKKKSGSGRVPDKHLDSATPLWMRLIFPDSDPPKLQTTKSKYTEHIFKR
jgi:hypothetical protein